MSQGFETQAQRAARRRRNIAESSVAFHNMPKATMSKNAVRRGLHTYSIKIRLRTLRGRFRFDVGRFLDRSKYNGDGSRK